MTTVITDPLSSMPLRKSADAVLRGAIDSGKPEALQRAIRKRNAKARRRLDRLLGESELSCLWSSDAIAKTADDVKLAEELNTAFVGGHSAKITAVCQNVATVIGNANAVPTLFHSLAAAELLLRHPDRFSAESFTQAFVGLSAQDTDSLFKLVEPRDADACPTPAQLVAMGELPYVLSLLFDPFQRSKLLRAHAVENIADCLEASSDTDGTVHAELAREVTSWMRPFVRITGWAKAFRERWARGRTLERWNQCLKRIGAISVPAGFVTEGGRNSTGDGVAIYAKAVSLCELPDDSPLPALAKSLTRHPTKNSKAKTTIVSSDASCQSDWAATALLRNRFTADADVISVEWEDNRQQLDLAVCGVQMLQGEWASRISVDGQAVAPVGNWVCTCWFQDDEVAFAELEAGSVDGVRHVRQVMLALTDHFAVITDTVTGTGQDCEIEFESHFGLSSQFNADSHPVTREIALDDGNCNVRAIPAWLEDDRIRNVDGDFTVADSSLILRAKHRGGVALPLILDWHPDREHRDADWNRLTVTEERQVLTALTANGFRVRIGSLQLLLYRSLRRGETLRAVLGHHTSSETMYAHVRNSGKIDPLVIVESDA